jgi:catechol 2,3-dioxygenase-like lactoylglutathione lyase family enzyme
MVRASFADLCVVDVERSTRFYGELLHLEVLVDHGWYAELGSAGEIRLALVEASHETVPIEAGDRPRGLLVSFDVDDADAVASVAHELGCRFVLEPVRELGQRHFMVADPDGAVVDVIERVDLDADDRRRLVRYRRQHRQGTAP